MGSQSKPTQPTMPDTIVPLVRRAVRRGSTTSDAKVTDVNNDLRKLSIGGKSNSEQSSPARLRRTVTSHDSQVPERRRSLLSTKSATPEPVTQQRPPSPPTRHGQETASRLPAGTVCQLCQWLGI